MSNNHKRKRNFLKLFGKKRGKKEQNQTKEEQINVPKEPITEKVEQPIIKNEQQPIGEISHNEDSPIKIRAVPTHGKTSKWEKKVQYCFLDDEDNWHDINFNIVFGYPFLIVDVYEGYEKFEELKKKLKTYRDVLDVISHEDKRNQEFIEREKEKEKRYKEISY